MSGYARELFSSEQAGEFHDFYRENEPRMYWLGVPVRKCPMDLWLYQELLWQIKPDVWIEGGTCAGGSALFIASVMDSIGKGRVVTMDWEEKPDAPKHWRITYVTGDTVEPATVQRVTNICAGFQRKILNIDDGHDQNHVERELHHYTPMLSPGDLLIVEDTNLGGPWWGLDRFLQTQPGRWEEIVDSQRFHMTYNPRGIWRRI